MTKKIFLITYVRQVFHLSWVWSNYLCGVLWQAAAQVLHQADGELEEQQGRPRGGEDGTAGPPHQRSSGTHGLPGHSDEGELEEFTIHIVLVCFLLFFGHWYSGKSFFHTVSIQEYYVSLPLFTTSAYTCCHRVTRLF